MWVSFENETAQQQGNEKESEFMCPASAAMAMPVAELNKPTVPILILSISLSYLIPLLTHNQSSFLSYFQFLSSIYILVILQHPPKKTYLFKGQNIINFVCFFFFLFFFSSKNKHFYFVYWVSSLTITYFVFLSLKHVIQSSTTAKYI